MKRVAMILAVVGMVMAVGGSAQAAITVETVTVGNPGNAAESTGHGGMVGAVGYAYNIGTYEVTAGQYTEFLNAVAATVDTYGLYEANMWNDIPGCKIQQTGDAGSYVYTVAADWANRPVGYVTWGDAARFANWLHNGQPTGAQDTSTTEDGAYYLNGAMTSADLLAVPREAGWKWAIASENEWYKAAYHKNDGVTGNYWDYPTQSDGMPTAEAPPGTHKVNGSANRYGATDYIDPTYHSTEVGAYTYKPSDSPYETFDQGGNILEWTEGIILGYMGGEYRCMRGGSFAGYGSDMSAEWGWWWGDQETAMSDYGFRVVTSETEVIPEPGTMIVWALLGAASWLGMGVWRRGRRIGRRPWSDENRTAILEIIYRGQA